MEITYNWAFTQCFKQRPPRELLKHMHSQEQSVTVLYEIYFARPVQSHCSHPPASEKGSSSRDAQREPKALSAKLQSAVGGAKGRARHSGEKAETTLTGGLMPFP